jgi:septal ring factor EnvC (AmiA/AmiB activator)
MTARPNTAAELAALRATLEADMRARERERLEAKEQRDNMAKDIHAIRANAVQIDNRVSNIEADMKSVKPVIASLENGKAKVAGAVIVLGAVGSIVIGFLTYFKQQVTQLIWGA